MSNTKHNSHRSRNNDRRYAGDYYYTEQAWPVRDEEWYRHTYGLPATGRRMGGQRRHDIAEWSNPSYTQNNSNREYQRINENHNDFEIERRDNAPVGDEHGTWNQRRDESYNWGENSRHNERPGLHRGKGPKGFIRTDERILEDIHSRLTDDAHVDASNIDVSVENGEVTLTGTVPDRFEKRRAEDITEFVAGVKNVENRLRIKRD